MFGKKVTHQFLTKVALGRQHSGPVQCPTYTYTWKLLYLIPAMLYLYLYLEGVSCNANYAILILIPGSWKLLYLIPAMLYLYLYLEGVSSPGQYVVSIDGNRRSTSCQIFFLLADVQAHLDGLSLPGNRPWFNKYKTVQSRGL